MPKVGRIGDPTTAPAVISGGSPNVIANEASATAPGRPGPLPRQAKHQRPAPQPNKTLTDSKLVWDKPSAYQKPNILPELPKSEVPKDVPTNAEQNDAPKIEDKPSNCDLLEFTNPIIEANKLLSLGDSAWHETGSNPNIKALWDSLGYDGSKFADHTAWCAVFVGAVLKRSGCKYVKSASSRAYANYGKEVKSLSEAQPGDILVFYRGGKGSGYGHVGFYTGNHTSDRVSVLGGNQSDSLNIKNFRISGSGWGLLTIRRATSCKDSTTEAPKVVYNKPGSGDGGKVV